MDERQEEGEEEMKGEEDIDKIPSSQEAEGFLEIASSEHSDYNELTDYEIQTLMGISDEDSNEANENLPEAEPERTAIAEEMNAHIEEEYGLSDVEIRSLMGLSEENIQLDEGTDEIHQEPEQTVFDKPVNTQIETEEEQMVHSDSDSGQDDFVTMDEKFPESEEFDVLRNKSSYVTYVTYDPNQISESAEEINDLIEIEEMVEEELGKKPLMEHGNNGSEQYTFDFESFPESEEVDDVDLFDHSQYDKTPVRGTFDYIVDNDTTDATFSDTELAEPEDAIDYTDSHKQPLDWKMIVVILVFLAIIILLIVFYKKCKKCKPPIITSIGDKCIKISCKIEPAAKRQNCSHRKFHVDPVLSECVDPCKSTTKPGIADFLDDQKECFEETKGVIKGFFGNQKECFAELKEGSGKAAIMRGIADFSDSQKECFEETKGVIKGFFGNQKECFAELKDGSGKGAISQGISEFWINQKECFEVAKEGINEFLENQRECFTGGKETSESPTENM